MVIGGAVGDRVLAVVGDHDGHHVAAARVSSAAATMSRDIPGCQVSAMSWDPSIVDLRGQLLNPVIQRLIAELHQSLKT